MGLSYGEIYELFYPKFIRLSTPSLARGLYFFHFLGYCIKIKRLADQNVYCLIKNYVPPMAQLTAFCVNYVGLRLTLP
jgi:hypothetical protein